jgi:glycosyltransferase involved in cell wall biosynthesis
MTRSLCVESWRFISHSYALINQWQLLSLLKRKDVALSVRDAPYYLDHWKPARGLFSAEQENMLASVPELGSDDSSDATLRISAPYDFSLCSRGRTAVFGTSEYQLLAPFQFKRPPDLSRLSQSGDFRVITPSRWSRQGFLRLGLREDQVVVVPHGVEPAIFHSSHHERASARQMLRLAGFTFLNASVMTENKGIDLLLRAFAVVAERYPGTRLILKGADALYSSKDLLRAELSNLPSRQQHIVVERMTYLGHSISMTAMSGLYQASDAYISPYRAEGFNLPVLEACACGRPVICTKGGPTDEFLTGDFALFADSRLSARPDGGSQLEPNLDHLIHLMFRLMEDSKWRERAASLGPIHAAGHFNWDLATDRLLNAIFPGSS